MNSDEDEPTDQFSSALHEFCGFEGVGGIVGTGDSDEEPEMTSAVNASGSDSPSDAGKEQAMLKSDRLEFDAFGDSATATDAMNVNPPTQDDDLDGFASFNQVPVQAENGFGAFDAFTNTPATEGDHKANDLGDFGGFSASKERSTVNNNPVSDSEANNTHNQMQSDDFGGFSAFNDAPDATDAVNQPEPMGNANDDFVAFSEFNDEPTTKDNGTQPTADHDFGGFTAFEDAFRADGPLEGDDQNNSVEPNCEGGEAPKESGDNNVIIGVSSTQAKESETQDDFDAFSASETGEGNNAVEEVVENVISGNNNIDNDATEPNDQFDALEPKDQFDAFSAFNDGGNTGNINNEVDGGFSAFDQAPQQPLDLDENPSSGGNDSKEKPNDLDAVAVSTGADNKLDEAEEVPNAQGEVEKQEAANAIGSIIEIQQSNTDLSHGSASLDQNNNELISEPNEEGTNSATGTTNVTEEVSKSSEKISHDDDNLASGAIGVDDFAGFPASDEQAKSITPANDESAFVQNDEIEADDFGGFASFEEAPAPTVVDEEGHAPIQEASDAQNENRLEEQTSHSDGNFAFGAVGVDDFAGFPASDEQVKSITPANDESAHVQNGEMETDDFEGFASFEEAPAPSIVDEEGHAPNQEATDAQNGIQPDLAVDTSNEFGDFGDFEEVTPLPSTSASADIHENTPIEEATRLKDAQNGNQPDLAVDNSNDFGDFGDFEEVTPLPSISASADIHEITPTQEATRLEDSQNGNQPDLAVDTSNEFGDFGDFEEVTPLPSTSASAGIHENTGSQNQPQPEVGQSHVEVDDFGDFGDFEEMPSVQVDEENGERNAEAAAPASSSDQVITEHQPPASTASPEENDDDFGDFGDFESEPISTTEQKPDTQAQHNAQTSPEVSTGSQSAHITILNENVRVMFETVFEHSELISLDSEKNGVTKLPFDVTLSSILNDDSKLDKKTRESCTHSEKSLGKIEQFLKQLPVSPSLSILSNENWNPYSQYVFSKDGSPIMDSNEPVSTSSVPDVLCINLPTGFDSNEFNKSSSTQATKTSVPRQSPTVVDMPLEEFPGSSNKREFDDSQLSSTGKKFLDQIPDLSYMLSSSLRLKDELG